MNKDSKRILLIAPQPFFTVRGTPINVRAMVETLSREGYEIDLLVYPFGENLLIPNVNILRSSALPGIKNVPIGASLRKVLLDIPLAFSALRLGITHKYHVFHGIEEGAFIAGTLGLISRKPFIFDMDSCMAEQLQEASIRKGRRFLFQSLSKLLVYLERFFAKRAAAILTVSEYLSEKAKEISGKTPIHQIEDFPVLPRTTISSQELRNRLNLGTEQVGLYTGNFEDYQGIDLLINSWAHVPSAQLLLVGGEDQQISKYKKLAKSLKIENRVLFAGSCPTEHIASYMELADILLSPRIVGGNTPLKIFSYMASAKPIVATTVKAHTTVLNNENAYLAAPDPLFYSKEILKALADPHRDQKAKAAKILAESKYSREAFDKRLLALYSFILSSRN